MISKFKQIFDLFNSSEKKSFFILFTLIFFSSLIDLLGIASIFPLITVLVNPQIIETNQILNSIYNKLNIYGINNSDTFLVFLGSFFLFFYFFSLIFRGFVIYFQVRFTQMREYSVGKLLLENYLQKPYVFFLNYNCADLNKNILSEINQVVNQTIVPMVNLIAQCTIIFVFIIFFLIINPVLIITTSIILFFTYGCIFFLINKYISKIGSETVQANHERFLSINEIFGAIKEIKFKGLEKYSINRYIKPAKVYATNQTIAKVAGQLPRYLIEALIFGVIIFFILSYIINGNTLSEILPFIALYTFAGFRLFPSFQQVYFSIIQLKFSSFSLDLIHKDLEKNPGVENYSNRDQIFLTKSITLKNIIFIYPNSKQPSLSNINISIKAYEKIGIFGASGSGKSTLVDIITGLLEPNFGAMSIDEVLINKNNRYMWQKNIAYVPQQTYLNDSSIASNIAFGILPQNIDYKAVINAAKIADLHDFVENQLENKYETIVGGGGVLLSGGQRQRIGIARAFYKNSNVIILDEATNALDYETEKRIIKSINDIKYKVTVIIISHRFNTLQGCNKIFILKKGKLINQGSYDEILKKNKIFLNKKLK
jgi:ABC-type bacteriocin/lantibiotic exporter with double-glycine peptidase domain